MNMEKRIDLELRGRTPSQVKELNLDNCRSTSIVGLSDAYTSLNFLSLNNVGLTTLKGFPALPNLRKLELSDNRISNGLNFLSGCPKLTHLIISGNRIQNLVDLEPLKKFTNLKYLDLFNNDVTSNPDYKSTLFELLPSVKYLDGFDKDDCEAEDSDEEDENDENDLNGNNDSDDDGSEDDDDEEDEDISLQAVYNANLHEESSDSELFDGSGMEEAESEDEVDSDDAKAQDGDENADAQPDEESTRGKKRKHEDEEN